MIRANLLQEKDMFNPRVFEGLANVTSVINKGHRESSHTDKKVSLKTCGGGNEKSHVAIEQC